MLFRSAEIVSQLEIPVNTRGDFTVLATLPPEGGAAFTIDLPGEAPGRIADRHWKQAYYESQKDYYCDLSSKPQTAGTSDFVYKFAYEFCLEGNHYRAGDAVNFAIGQVFVASSRNPCQTYVATLIEKTFPTGVLSLLPLWP